MLADPDATRLEVSPAVNRVLTDLWATRFGVCPQTNRMFAYPEAFWITTSLDVTGFEVTPGLTGIVVVSYGIRGVPGGVQGNLCGCIRHKYHGGLKDHATMEDIGIMDALGAIRLLTDTGVIQDTAVTGTTRFLSALGEIGFV